MVTIGLTNKEVKEGIKAGIIFYKGDNIQFGSEVNKITNKKDISDIVGNVIQVYFELDRKEKFTLLGFEMLIVREIDFSKCKGFSEYLDKE